MLISLKKETLLNNFYTCLISLKKKSLQKCISAQNFDSSCLSSKRCLWHLLGWMVAGEQGEGGGGGGWVGGESAEEA